jgi:hypothetical protein
MDRVSIVMELLGRMFGEFGRRFQGLAGKSARTPEGTESGCSYLNAISRRFWRPRVPYMHLIDP